MEMNKEQRTIDLINAFALYKAKEAGAFGRAKLETQEVGTIGGLVTDVQLTLSKLNEGQITKNQAKEAIKQSIETTIKISIKKAAFKAVDAVAEYANQKIPVLRPVIDATKEFVKNTIIDKVVDKAVEVGKAAVDKVRDFFKKRVRKIFS